MSELRVVIVGGGLGGMATAIELRRHGFEHITILDRAPRLGGTWHYNTYPGCACDVPSHLYSFSYARRREWSRLCSPQEEILDYIDDVAREFDLHRLLVAGVDVVSCEWSDVERSWSVRAADGREWQAEAVVLATGQLHQPAAPALPGTFAGHAFHSARWDHGYDLRSKRVAVIGTGASAVQLVPEIAGEVSKLHVFQRTGNWFLPRRNRPYPPAIRALIRWVPGVQALRRRFIYQYAETLTAMIRRPRTLGRLGWLRSWLFMRWQLRGRPDLRRRVWPDYAWGCKRILFSSYFLPALRRAHVEVVTEPIERLTSGGIVTRDGVERELDCLIYATGFATTEFMFPMEVVGEGGRSLRSAWAQGPHAHLGITVPGFPSLFIVYGPNTNTSGGSIIVYEEAQAAYIRQALALVQARRAAAISVRADVEQASDRVVQESFRGTAWTECQSWYRDQSGRIVSNWPGYMRQYEDRVRVLDPREFTLLELPERAEAAAPGR